MQRQVISVAFSQVVLLLEAIFQRHPLMVSENRTGPGKGLRSPVCTVGTRVGNINTPAEEF